MMTLAEIIIGLIFAATMTHLVLCTWMVWGIAKQLAEREEPWN